MKKRNTLLDRGYLTNADVDAYGRATLKARQATPALKTMWTDWQNSWLTLSHA